MVTNRLPAGNGVTSRVRRERPGLPTRSDPDLDDVPDSVPAQLNERFVAGVAYLVCEALEPVEASALVA